MERIDLYDKYINELLSEKERVDFDAKLKSDRVFAEDFMVYLFTINGICREANQNNIDFGLALKNLSKEQLKEIIGKQETEQMKAIAESSYIRKPQIPRFRAWMWQVAAIAAIVIITFTAVFNIEKSARYSVDNAIFACADVGPDMVRGGAPQIDIKSMSDEELKAKLPGLINLYQSASNLDEVADNGFALAMAYLHLHDRDNAKAILEQLVSKFDGDEYYLEDVNKWKEILSLLK